MYSAIIIGSGFSGLCMGIKLKERGVEQFLILEKSDEVGGTWRENTYPGAECDIPSALYSYSFEPYPDWEYKWSHQPQILDYLKLCTKKYDLYDHLQFNREFTGANWDEEGSFWMVQTKDNIDYKCKTLVIAVGQLHHPSFPDIKGSKTFNKPHFHSAQWNHEINLENKKIGVIGNAASAVQFIPQIAKEASEIFVFQRSANWMLPKQDRAYKNWEKTLVKRMPFLLKLYRLRLWLLGGGLYSLMKIGNSVLRRIYENKTKSYIKKHISDPETFQKLVPNYPMGAKRILFSDDYYETLAKDHVHLITTPIDTISEDGVRTRDREISIDVLIYATGFQTNPFLNNLSIAGRSGRILKDHWKKGPRNYLGITVDQFPNLFMMYGPNTNLGHNSIIIMSEAQANYIAQCIAKIDGDDTNSLEVKKSVLDKYYDSIQKRLKGMIWSQIDNSWYKTDTGTIPNNWPGRTMEYTRLTKKVNFNDYLIRYK